MDSQPLYVYMWEQQTTTYLQTYFLSTIPTLLQRIIKILPFYIVQVLMIVLPVQFSVRHEALLFVNFNWDPNNVRSVLMTWFN